MVKINDTYSTESSVQCGVPQGTILGPILFISYINDLFNALPSGDIVSFADDTVAMTRDNSWKSAILNAECKLNIVAKWLYRNHLTLNNAKTVYLTFGSYINSLPQNASIRVHKRDCDMTDCNCDAISWVNVTKYLGAYIDSHMSWHEHLIKVCNKTRYLIYIFYKIKNLLKIKQLVSVYYVLFWSTAMYGIIVWGGTHDKNIYPCQCLQNKILKLIYNKPF